MKNKIPNNNLDEHDDHFFKVHKNSYNVYFENNILEETIKCKL